MAVWLLDGGQLIDRIEWIIENGFEGVSFLQNAIDIDRHERRDAAAAISSAQLYVTYHGNVHHKLKESGGLDTDFTGRMMDDVIWWHEHTNGVSSCCSDPINLSKENGMTAFDFDLNKTHMDSMAGRLNKYGIRVGIENSFGGKNKFCTLKDMAHMKEMCSGYHIGMLLDAAHANIHVRNDGIEHEGNMAAYVGKLPLEVLEVHFSDNFGTQDEHKQLGYGNVNLHELFGALKSNGFAGKFTIEICVDILSGKYGSNIFDSRQTDKLLISRDKIRTAWSALK